MVSDQGRVAEQGILTPSDEALVQAREWQAIIGPLAKLNVVEHVSADAAVHELGLSGRQMYVLIQRSRQGSGLITDLVSDQSGRGKGKGKGKGRLSGLVESTLREALRKRFKTR